MLSNPSSKEIARQYGAEEIEILRQRVLLWKEDYCRHAPAAGGEDYLFLVNEFAQEIEEYLYPYIRRLRDTNHLDQTQVDEFLGFCYELVHDLQDYITPGAQN
jgi:hypothetical protein